MGEERSFGAYIREKRLGAGLTQKELAGRLHVSESAVSKWERDLSYPDVSMVPAICRELSISEHEFFTACDDEHARTVEREAATWRRAVRGLRGSLNACYLGAVVVCFICDLAVFHRLDWFWIVLASVALAFSLTSLPVLVSRSRRPICLGAASGCLMLLLAACWAYTGNQSVLSAAVILLVSLALPWSWWAIWRLCRKRAAPLCLAAFSVWVFLLLLAIWAVTFGRWQTLLHIAYPIAAFCLVFVWLCFGAIYWLPVGAWLKAAVCSLLVTFFIPLGNTLSAAMVPEQHTPVLLDYLAWWHIFTRESVSGFSWINVLVFWIMLAVSAVLLAAGAVREGKRRSGKV